MQILVVEDEALTAMMIEGALSDAGHTVRGPASTASRALKLVEIAQPDLALVDINLRDGRGSGIGLARELQKRWGIPSLFVSGQITQARENRDAALGCLEKPYGTETLVACVAVADRLKQGETVPPEMIPPGLELFA